MKVTAIRDVVAHADVALPSGNTFTTKSVKVHGVANYIFSFGARIEVEWFLYFIWKWTASLLIIRLLFEVWVYSQIIEIEMRKHNYKYNIE